MTGADYPPDSARKLYPPGSWQHRTIVTVAVLILGLAALCVLLGLAVIAVTLARML